MSYTRRKEVKPTETSEYLKNVIAKVEKASKDADTLAVKIRELGEEIHGDIDKLKQTKKKVAKEQVFEECIEDRYPYGGSYCSADMIGYVVACLLRGVKYWRWDGRLIEDQDLPEWIDLHEVDLINDWRKDQRVLEVRWRHPISNEVRNYVMFPGEYLLFDFEPRILYSEKLERYFNYIEEQKKGLSKYLGDHINGIRVLAETIEEIRGAKRNHG